MTANKERRTMISAISWIPKGASKSEPFVADPHSQKDIQEFINVVDEPTTLTVANDAVCDDVTLALKDLHMEHYDDEDEELELFSSGTGDLYYPSNDVDPYLKDKNNSKTWSFTQPILSLFVRGARRLMRRIVTMRRGRIVSVFLRFGYSRTEKQTCIVIMRSKFRHLPLCTAWLDCPLRGGERGNFLAVGSMEPSIEIWNLDVVEEVKPCVVLGGIDEEKRKGKMKSIKYKDDGHTDSVLGLAWNKEYRNILASASADKRVKIWDVVTGKCEITMEHHSDKVQAVAWNHHAPQVLLSGSFDHTVVVKDGRMPSHSGYKWSVTADVESLAWDPHSEHSFVVSLEDGIVKCFDVRTIKSDSTSELSSTFTLHAHDEAVTSVSYNLSAPNLLATGSLDKTVKLWDLSNNQPSCVASYFPKIGAIYSISFSEDNPFLLAIGGSKKKLRVWDTLSDSGISQRYGNYK
ncbi:WD repeat-containing protein [Spatholobus suberectus]|nr:WD repeat-containing protein [Spatholobus suberectus]